MAIEKLPEFAKNGQKDTDKLNQEDGFPVNLKPARQWFNYLFNKLSLTVNLLIDEDYLPRHEIINNLTTKDAKKPLSAEMGVKLKDVVTRSGLLDIGANNHISKDGPITSTRDVSDNGFYRVAADSTSTMDTWPNQSSGDALINAQWSKGFGFQLGSAKSINSLYFRTVNTSNYKIWVKLLGEVDVIDNLTSNIINRPLSANQGRIINEAKLDKTANAISASKLQTPRTISFSGAATGSFNFDGSANGSCILTLANSGVAAGTYGSNLKIPVITLNAKGLATVAAMQDIPVFSGTTSVGLVPARVGSTTDKFLNEAGVWGIPTNTTYSVITDAEMKEGIKTTSRTVSAKVLKEAILYHAPAPVDITGNAGTATKLLNPRKINGVGFDGGSDINCGFGFNQRWYDMSSTTALNTTYVNTSGLPILINMFTYTLGNTSAEVEIYVDNMLVARSITRYSSTEKVGFASAVVPNNSNYSLRIGLSSSPNAVNVMVLK